MVFKSYEVGSRILDPTMQDATHFDLTDAGGILLVEMRGPTASEKREFKRTIQFKVAVIDDIVFIVYRCGMNPWSDAPYYIGRSPDLHSIPSLGEGQGLAVHCLLVDSSTGTLVAQKLVGMDRDAAAKLLKAVQSQPNIPDFDARVRRIYAQYNTEQLLEVANAN